MTPAYLVSTARTPLARSYKGAFKDVAAPSLFGWAIAAAVERAGVPADAVEDVIMGCALPEGSQYYNIGRLSALAAGLPETVAGMTVDRQCASGLMSIAHAAQQVQTGQAEIVVAGGGEQLSLVQNQHMNTHMNRDPALIEQAPDIYMPMLETAENVAQRYGISRSEQDEFACRSHALASSAAAQALFQQEIVPITAAQLAQFHEVDDAVTQAPIAADQNVRPNTTLDALSALNPVMENGNASITAGNACSFADGAAALVVASETAVKRYGLQPLGQFSGVAVTGCAPDEMGIGPVLAVPKLLQRFGLNITDIDHWELNEAFASQALYCHRELGLPLDKINPNGGAIALGHPYGMTGARMVGSALLAAQNSGAKYAVITMCIGGGQGAAGLIINGQQS